MSATTPFDRMNIELFTPDQIPNLSLWLDANDVNTITLSGSTVTQWRDKSSNNHICVSNANYAGTTLPTFCNVNPRCVNFEPNQALVTSGFWNYTTAWSCFVAINSITLGSRWLISPHNSVSPVLMGMNQGTNKIFNNAFNSVPADITGRHIEYTSAENTNANSNLLWFRDGTQQASNVRSLGGAANPNARMGIGANATLNNSMAGTYQLNEVLIFNRFISATERQQIESYLAYKWNLQSVLPTSHPFRTTPYNIYYGLSIPNVNLTNNLSRFPSEIPGLQLWLDAADSSTLTLSGNNISQWRDKSGSNNNATQVNSLIQPTYSNTFVNFNGINQLFNVNLDFLAGATHNSFIVIRNFNFNNIYGALNSALANQSLHIGFQNSVSYRINFWGNDYYPVITSNYRANQINLLNFQWVNNTSKAVLTNASLEGTFNQPGIIGTMSGGGSIGGVVTQGSLPQGFLNANIHEMLIYTGTLSVPQRQQIESYLMYKWNLESNLPSNHPAFIPPMPVNIPRTITNYIFSPTIFSGLSVWLDGSDLNSFTFSGANITQWRDKSGNARHASISGTVTFSNSNVITNGTSPNSFSVPLDIRRTTLSNLNLFIVYNQNNITTPTTQALWGNDVGGGWNRFQTLNNTNGSFAYIISGGFFGGAQNTFAISNINNTNKQIYNVSYSLSNINNSFVFTNGSLNRTFTEYSSQNETTTTNIFFGTINNTGFYGNIAYNEIIVFNRTMNANERQQIEGYLAWKYGLQANLPSVHPFRIFPPG
jgi:hypothetical protein